jgi:phosphatidylserine/phosphatidylglycerophosphate/cardiolipin synthase-like enzyme
MSITTTFLEQGKQKPEAIASLLADFLSAAKTSLHLAIYDFRFSDGVGAPVVKALQDRAAAGVEVRLVYDAGKLTGPVVRAGGDPAPPGTSAFVKKLGSGIASKPITGGDPQQPRLMHHKYIVRDGQTPQAALWTGSMNWTEDSWTIQENNIIRIDSPALCTYYENDFAELWARGDIATTGAHDSGTVQVGTTTVKVAFAPGDGMAIDHEIAGQISKARRRLRVCSMLLTSGAILGALNDTLKHRTLDYTGIYDRTQMDGVIEQWRGQPSEWKIAAFEFAVQGLAGKRSTPYTPTSVHDFMHNKVLVADDTVITGSYNLSHSATENAENILMIHDPELAERYVAYIEGLVKRYQAS